MLISIIVTCDLHPILRSENTRSAELLSRVTVNFNYAGINRLELGSHGTYKVSYLGDNCFICNSLREKLVATK